MQPSSLAQLKKNHIDLWYISPALLSESSLEYLKTLLSNEEHEKLRQYKNKKAQHTALVTRSISRLILSQYTDISPSELTFSKNKHGKPKLINNKNNITFNLSHNNELIIMAVCANDEVGCDIENPLRKINNEPITRRYFSTQEHNELCNLKNEMQQKRFFEMWTLKEAFVKATGVGITLGLGTFYFNMQGSKNNISIAFNDDYPLDTHHKWQFHQQELLQQLLAISRSSQLKQAIHFLNAKQLIPV